MEDELDWDACCEIHKESIKRFCFLKNLHSSPLLHLPTSVSTHCSPVFLKALLDKYDQGLTWLPLKKRPPAPDGK